MLSFKMFYSILAQNALLPHLSFPNVLLAHVSVSEGDVLAAGDAIGRVGSTGRVERPQLHFEIRKSRQPIDPRSLIS